MNEAFDLTSIRKTLQNGLKAGLWSMDNLDQESAGASYNRRCWAKHPMNRSFKIKPHVNLLRTNEVIEPETE